MLQKKLWPFLALGALFLMPVQTTFAWNATGHELIAYIAFDNLVPATRAKIAALLRAHADYAGLLTQPATPEGDPRDREAFLTAATWPDLARQPATPRYRYNHPTWHYVDFPFVVGELSTKPAEPQLHWKPDTDPANAAQAYEKCLADLTNDKLPDPERAMALCWVEHLVGDIHQPLHAISLFSADFPEGDKGGNDITVMASGKATNLHALWDGLEGDYQTPALIEFSAERLMKKLPRKDVESQVAILDFEKWARTSAQEARETVYLQGKLAGVSSALFAKNKSLNVPELPPGYLEAATNLADENITLAGYRLAAVLNAALKAQ